MPNILGQNFIAGGRSALGQSLQKAWTPPRVKSCLTAFIRPPTAKSTPRHWLPRLHSRNFVS